MIYGNTTDYTKDFVRNNAVVNGYIIGDMIGQIHKRPTGPAARGVPARGGDPTKKKNFGCPKKGGEANQPPPRLWNPISTGLRLKKDKQLLLQGAEAVFDNIMEGLADMGIDMKNPAEIMITCKELGTGVPGTGFWSGGAD